ncbi:MAG: hypothetical protein HKN41_12855, partial [Ilumatobacter sp.]|nr:hypothetical protein [Ilumatobacter sp.]
MTDQLAVDGLDDETEARVALDGDGEPATTTAPGATAEVSAPGREDGRLG